MFQEVFPILSVADLSCSLRCYRDLLGCTVTYRFPDECEAVFVAVRAAARQLLAGHVPYPAIVVDRGWELIDANTGVSPSTAGLPPKLLAPPTNVLRASLHPEDQAPRLENLGASVRVRQASPLKGSGCPTAAPARARSRPDP